MREKVAEPVIDSIIRSGRKSVALVVTEDAKLIVRAPYRTTERYIKELVREKRKWITEKQQAARLKFEARTEKRVATGEEFLYLGEKYRLKIREGKPLAELQPGILTLQLGPDGDAGALLEAWYRKQAKRVLAERVGHCTSLTGLRPRSVSVTGARRRWGSCGPKNSLNFAWRLVMAPVEVIDYVVVHELAHIEFKNHSKGFWARVATIMPDYRLRKSWLVRNQKLMEIL